MTRYIIPPDNYRRFSGWCLIVDTKARPGDTFTLDLANNHLYRIATNTRTGLSFTTMHMHRFIPAPILYKRGHHATA